MQTVMFAGMFRKKTNIAVTDGRALLVGSPPPLLVSHTQPPANITPSISGASLLFHLLFHLLHLRLGQSLGHSDGDGGDGLSVVHALDIFEANGFQAVQAILLGQKDLRNAAQDVHEPHFHKLKPSKLTPPSSTQTWQ